MIKNGKVNEQEFFDNTRHSKKQYEQMFKGFAGRAVKLLYTENILDRVLKVLSSGNPIESVANVTVSIVGQVEKSIERTRDVVPDPVRVAGANVVMGELFEIGEKSGFFELSEEEKEACFAQAVSKWINEGVKRGTIDKKQLAEVMGSQVSQLDPEERQKIDESLKRIDVAARGSIQKYGSDEVGLQKRSQPQPEAMPQEQGGIL
jgi:uncharacterized protein YidB (DUF937 family)